MLHCGLVQRCFLSIQTNVRPASHLDLGEIMFWCKTGLGRWAWQVVTPTEKRVPFFGVNQSTNLPSLEYRPCLFVFVCVCVLLLNLSHTVSIFSKHVQH